MSHEHKEKASFFWNFIIEFRHILEDVLFVYRHFLHWTLSRIIVSVWSIILGIILSLPFFLVAVILAWIDPIPWLLYFQENASDAQIALDHLANHPYWFMSIVFFLLVSGIFFLLASSYSLLLFARISYKYTQRKLLPYKKNLYFSRKHIATFLSLFSLNFLYLLAPALVWSVGAFVLYFLYHTELIWFSLLSYSLLGLTLVFIFALWYVSYRILFGYIILATHKDASLVHSARKYIQSSLKITQGKNILKFFFLLAIYALITFPFQYIDTSISLKITSMQDALNYKSKLVENIDESEMSYYRYLSEEYDEYSNQEIIDSIMMYSRLSVAYFVFYNLVFWGLFVMLLSSFYVRVLRKD